MWLSLKLPSLEALFQLKIHTKWRLAAGLRPDPLSSLSAPSYFLGMAGRKYENKGRRKTRKELWRSGKAQSFYDHLARSPAQPQFAHLRNKFAAHAMGVNVGSVDRLDPTRPDPRVYRYP